MLCPSCQQRVFEQSPACPACGFTLAAADRVFGIPPQLKPGLSDLAAALRTSEEKRIAESMKQFAQEFPQVPLACVLMRIPREIPLPVYAFWLFNRSGLTSPMDTGGSCRLLFLLLDVEHHRAVSMVGYGLEPFVTRLALEDIARAAIPAMEQNDPAKAVRDSLSSAGQELALIADDIPLAFGLRPLGQEDEADEDEFVITREEVFAY